MTLCHTSKGTYSRTVSVRNQYRIRQGQSIRFRLNQTRSNWTYSFQVCSESSRNLGFLWSTKSSTRATEREELSDRTDTNTAFAWAMAEVRIPSFAACFADGLALTKLKEHDRLFYSTFNRHISEWFCKDENKSKLNLYSTE